MTTETAARMLAKGIADQITLVPLGNGTYSTRSAKTPFGVTYTTTVDACTCPATAHCKHIAHVQVAEAKKRTPAPIPATEDASDMGHIIEGMLAELWDQQKAEHPEPEQPCPYCNGDGRRDFQDEVRPGVWQWTSEPCTICQPDANYMGWWR
jgi:hypothetical protein